MKTIGIVTGARSEYGLLEPLIKLIHEGKEHPILYVTGSHLSPEFGMTVNHIQYPITAKIECVLSSDTAEGISKGFSLAISGFASEFSRYRPDILVLLGDRWETLAAGMAAHIAGIPIAHIHGGEETRGSYDNAFRHSITHMATWHFPATEEAYVRIWQLIDPLLHDNIFQVGALGCDGLRKRSFSNRRNLIAIIIHPETINNENSWFKNFTKYIDDRRIASSYRESFIFIKGGNDKHWGRFSTNIIENSLPLEWGSFKNQKEFLDYISIKCDALVGNSSAGIIEMPALGVPTINIGDRQKGREIARSIINAGTTEAEWTEAFSWLYSDKFQALMKTDYHCPYQGENVAQKIYEVLKGL